MIWILKCALKQRLASTDHEPQKVVNVYAIQYEYVNCTLLVGPAVLAARLDLVGNQVVMDRVTPLLSLLPELAGTIDQRAIKVGEHAFQCDHLLVIALLRCFLRQSQLFQRISLGIAFQHAGKDQVFMVSSCRAHERSLFSCGQLLCLLGCMGDQLTE